MDSERQPQAIALLSGGLDSILALRLMLGQGLNIVAVHMVTPFCTCTSGRGCSAWQVARRLGVPVRAIPVGDDYVAMVRNPQHGRGANLNPCIDCRIYLFTLAKRLMEETGAQFIFTGEVLGERPMSQRRVALRQIEQAAGLEGKILRPLSAQFFPPTDAEKGGLVDRSQLLRIQGRSRAPQMKLAAELGENDYPCPAGGCLLTDPLFCRKVEDAFAHDELTVDDMLLLRHGRHYRLPDGSRLAAGKNERENRALRGLARAGDVVLALPHGLPGPLAVLRRARSEATVHLAAQIVAALSDLATEASVPIIWYDIHELTEVTELWVHALPKAEVRQMRIVKDRKA
jgi:tRNA-specific 2-thiouridylase